MRYKALAIVAFFQCFFDFFHLLVIEYLPFIIKRIHALPNKKDVWDHSQCNVLHLRFRDDWPHQRDRSFFILMSRSLIGKATLWQIFLLCSSISQLAENGSPKSEELSSSSTFGRFCWHFQFFQLFFFKIALYHCLQLMFGRFSREW